METLNHTDVLAELTACHESYERALVNNDVEVLQRFFWDSPDAVRYGVGENLYGASEIDAFRKARPNINLNRDILRLQIFAFDSVTGIVNLEFRRVANGTLRHGRQSQFWRKFQDGWKVVSGHISFLPIPSAEDYVDSTARLIGLPLDPAYRQGVIDEFSRSSAVAATLLNFSLSEEIELAPVFEP
jgi:hypothetical protein